LRAGWQIVADFVESVAKTVESHEDPKSEAEQNEGPRFDESEGAIT